MLYLKIKEELCDERNYGGDNGLELELLDATAFDACFVDLFAAGDVQRGSSADCGNAINPSSFARGGIDDRRTVLPSIERLEDETLFVQYLNDPADGVRANRGALVVVSAVLDELIEFLRIAEIVRASHYFFMNSVAVG